MFSKLFIPINCFIYTMPSFDSDRNICKKRTKSFGSETERVKTIFFWIVKNFFLNCFKFFLKNKNFNKSKLKLLINFIIPSF